MLSLILLHNDRMIRLNLSKRLENIPSNIDEKDHRFFVFCNYMFTYGMMGHIFFIPLFYIAGNPSALIINIFAVFFDLLALYLNKKGYTKLAPTIWLLWIYIHTINSIVAFGIHQGYAMYFLSFVIMVFFSRWPITVRMTLTLMLFMTTFMMHIYSEQFAPVTVLSRVEHEIMYFSNALANFSALAYAAFYYRRYAEFMESQLTVLANTDSLTGIYNRRFFEKMVSCRISKKSSTDYAMLFLDVDHFKIINDTYGHAVGDRALQEASQICQDNLRKGDILGRIGGEEFGIFLEGVNKEMALQIAERIRTSFENRLLKIDDIAEFRMTVSIGLVFSKSQYEDLSAIMHRSDDALYEAKNNGRNRIIVYN